MVEKDTILKVLMMEVREALDGIWKTAALKGRCWGTKPLNGENNPFLGSNITLGMHDEIVSVSIARNGELLIHEFRRTKNTELGKMVKIVLKEKDLTI